MKVLHMLTSRLTLVVKSIIIATAIVGSGQAHAAKTIEQKSIILPKSDPDINLGKMNYNVKCATCHGINAAGSAKGPSFLNRVYHPGHHGDAAFINAPKQGAKAHHWTFGDMPPVEGITDGQIAKIITYIRALQKANGIF